MEILFNIGYNQESYERSRNGIFVNKGDSHAFCKTTGPLRR